MEFSRLKSVSTEPWFQVYSPGGDSTDQEEFPVRFRQCVDADCTQQRKHKHCMLCYQNYDTPSHQKRHFVHTHLKRSVMSQENIISLKCKLHHAAHPKCKKSHYHCPICLRLVYLQSRFERHLVRHILGTKIRAARGDTTTGRLNAQESMQAVTDLVVVAAQSAEELDRNRKRKHDGEKMEDCPVCSKTMRVKSILRHCRDVHRMKTESVVRNGKRDGQNNKLTVQLQEVEDASVNSIAINENMQPSIAGNLLAVGSNEIIQPSDYDSEVDGLREVTVASSNSHKATTTTTTVFNIKEELQTTEKNISSTDTVVDSCSNEFVNGQSDVGSKKRGGDTTTNHTGNPADKRSRHLSSTIEPGNDLGSVNQVTASSKSESVSVMKREIVIGQQKLAITNISSSLQKEHHSSILREAFDSTISQVQEDSEMENENAQDVPEIPQKESVSGDNIVPNIEVTVEMDHDLGMPVELCTDKSLMPGLEFIQPISGYHCILCRSFYPDYSTAMRHCLLLSHRMRVMTERQVGNRSPM